jgi:hypothetical protein
LANPQKNNFINYDGYSFDPEKAWPQVSIRPNYFVSYLKYSSRSGRRDTEFVTGADGNRTRVICSICKVPLNSSEILENKTKCSSCVNLDNNKHNGNISVPARNRLQLGFDWMYLLSKSKKAWNDKYQHWYNFKLALLTVKLPCKQLMHEYDPRRLHEKYSIDPITHVKTPIPNPLTPEEQSDLYIKKFLLNELLTILRKKYKLYFYIWRAEKQSDEVLHFHILHDTFTPYNEINHIWNNILNTHGYIDQYRTKQQEFHKDGFRFRPEWASGFHPETGKPSKIWSYQDQKRAYIKGVATNWRNPVGTSDVHSIHSVHNTKAYLAKYISKPMDVKNKLSQEIKKIKEEKGIEEFTDVQIQELEKNILKRLQINGRLWYISQPLSHLKSIICEVSDTISELCHKIYTVAPSYFHQSEYCRIFRISIRDIINKNYTPLLEPVKTFISECRIKSPKWDNNIFSALGIQLDLFS